MDKTITMSRKELRYNDIIKKLVDGEINGSIAAKSLKITTRQVRRLKSRYKEKGVDGLIHASRGEPSNRSIPNKEKNKIINLLNSKYPDFGPTFASEKLDEDHNLIRDPKTIRAIMIDEGLWIPKKVKKKKGEHHTWRQRKANYGEMLQYDGSYDYWFENRADKSCLLASIDDANSEVYAKFDEHEGVFPTYNFWKEYTKEKGKPFSVYVDRFSTYSMNHKLAKENPDTLTQFERAMKELNIDIIHAKSSQAKGRVERLFKTLQDRLIKELRLNNISTIKEANRFLKEIFLPKFNEKFMVEARGKANYHKKLSRQEKKKLDNIFSRQYERRVRNDFTISYKTKWYQLTEEKQPVNILKKDKVTIEERLDSTIHIRLRGKYLNYKELPKRPKKINREKLFVIIKGVKITDRRKLRKTINDYKQAGLVKAKYN